MSEQVKRFYAADDFSGEECVYASAYDALAHRCRELEAERTKLRSTLAAIPTAEAYDAACAALWKHRDDAEALRATLTAARDKLGPAVRNGHPALIQQAAEDALALLEAACVGTAGDAQNRN